MRLQVIGAIAAVLFWSEPAAPEGRAASWVSIYSSNDGLTVVSPQLSTSIPIRDVLNVDVEFDADVITAASVDLMTAASPRGYQETRHGYTLGATYHPDAETDIGAHYIPSFEPDYESHGLTISASREWIDRRLTTEIGYRLTFDAVGRSGTDSATWRSLTTNGVSLGLAWVFNPKTVGQLVYELQVHAGYQSSPYRWVPIHYFNIAGPVGAPERVPEDRTRHALSGAVRRALGGGWFGAASLRFYVDTWGIVSHTEELDVQLSLFRSRLIFGFAARTYGQSSASFHEYRYSASNGAIPVYRSADKILSSSWSLLAGPRVDVGTGRVGPLDDIRGTFKVEIYDQHFFAFAPLEERRAVILSFGAAGEF